MKIYLIGITGSGKSTLGRLLAEKMKYNFVDLDDYIIEQEGKSIEVIFAENGEQDFRKLEHLALEELAISDENLVISTGGGAPCFFDNMELINGNGLSIWLDINAKIISERLNKQSNKQNRPLIQNKSEEEVFTFINDKIKERRQFYSKAKIHITNQDPQVNDLLSEIKKYHIH